MLWQRGAVRGSSAGTVGSGSWLSVPGGREGSRPSLMVSSSSLPCPSASSKPPSAGPCMSHRSPSSTLCIKSEGKEKLCCSGAFPVLSAPSPAGDVSVLWPSAQFFSLEPGDSCASSCQFSAAIVPFPPPASAALQILGILRMHCPALNFS